MKRCAALLPFFLLVALLPGLSLDREAFTITRYRLDVRIDPQSRVIAVTGRLSMRNDSKSPQKFVTLQVSSSLAWNGVAADDRPVDCNCIVFPGQHPLEWLGDNYTSDIDHTGSLSEAIVTLPKEVSPGASINLDVQYGGTITQNATRLTRIGAPATTAARNDWDRISESFTTVRGLGYVTWYPVAVDAVSLSDGNAVFDAIARWKNRHQSSAFLAHIAIPLESGNDRPCLITNPSTPGTWSVGGGTDSPPADQQKSELNSSATYGVTVEASGLGEIVPTFAILENCTTLSRPSLEIVSTPGHADLAKDYAVAAEASDSFLRDWVGAAQQPPHVIELTDPDANPYQNGAVLFTPLREGQTGSLELLLVPTQVAARFHSPRPWIQNGLERFLQAMLIHTRVGRKAALQFLDEDQEPLVRAEEQAHPKAGSTAKNPVGSDGDNTLLNTSDELYLRGKASFVFWMLRDMVKDEALQRALTEYHPIADKDASYFQRLLETSSKRELEWFFDDWVYRDRGLPEFHVVSAYVRPLLAEPYKSFVATATIENKGRAGAEVPVLIETPSGDKVVRVVVKAGEQGVGRIEVPITPRQIKVNDGSVPESNHGNNVYDLPNPQQP